VGGWVGRRWSVAPANIRGLLGDRVRTSEGSFSFFFFFLPRPASLATRGLPSREGD
jgi:hypothetical protein